MRRDGLQAEETRAADIKSQKARDLSQVFI